MELVRVNKENISYPYDLNVKLAESENKKHLFTADRQSYADAFLPLRLLVLDCCLMKTTSPLVSICKFKFASCVGSQVLYIEDL